MLAAAPSGLQASQPVTDVRIGIDGQAVLGHWVPVRFRVAADSEWHQVALTTVDGSGARHTYRYDLPDVRLGQSRSSQSGTGQSGTGSGDNQYEVYVRFGRRSGGLQIRLSGSGESTAIWRLDQAELDERVEFQASIRPLVLSIGSVDVAAALGINAVSHRSDEDFIAIRIQSLERLPVASLGYDGIRKILLAVDEFRWSAGDYPDQIGALQEWLQMGGELIVSAGEAGEELLGQSGPMQSLVKVPVTGSLPLENTGRIEYFVSQMDPLVPVGGQPLTISRVAAGDMHVLLAAAEGPLVYSAASGFGRVVFCAFDLTDPRVSQWAGYRTLLSKLSGIEPHRADEKRLRDRSGRVTHIGFEDISGQLRASLDQFSNVGKISFTQVAVLVGVFILLIGPVDYFVLRKIGMRMEWTWLTFSLIIIGFSALSVLLYRSVKPKEVQVNQVNLIELDSDSGLARGATWCHLFEPSSRRRAFALTVPEAYASDLRMQWLSWQGLPGSGLGGMQTAAGLTSSGEYTQTMQKTPQKVEGSIQSLALQPGSTTSLTGRWFGSSTLSVDSRLSERNRQLVGTFTNPFDFKLRRAVVFYRDTVYVLEQAVDPGETIDIFSGSRARNIQIYYTTERNAKEIDEKKRWDVSSFNIQEIMELAMMFRAADGAAYTRLTSQYLDGIDASHLLETNRALLVASTDQLLQELEIDGRQTPSELDKSFNFVRVIMPVEPGNLQR